MVQLIEVDDEEFTQPHPNVEDEDDYSDTGEIPSTCVP